MYIYEVFLDKLMDRSHLWIEGKSFLSTIKSEKKKNKHLETWQK